MSIKSSVKREGAENTEDPLAWHGWQPLPQQMLYALLVMLGATRNIEHRSDAAMAASVLTVFYLRWLFTYRDGVSTCCTFYSDFSHWLGIDPNASPDTKVKCLRDLPDQYLYQVPPALYA